MIRQARELADVYEVELHVVHVREAETDVPVSDAVPRSDLERISEETEKRAMEKATRIAHEAAHGVEGRGEFEPVGLVGDVAREIIDYCEQHDAEYIVVSARKRSSLGQVLFGSVSQSLLLNADRPVVAAPYEPE